MRYLTIKPDSIISNFENDLDSLLTGNFFEKFLDKKTRELSMPVDLKEYDDAYEIKAELPGIKKDDVDIDIAKNHLRISAKKEEEKEEKHKKYHKTEFRYGETSRTLYFPENIKTDEANAKMENGILKIRLPKEEKDHEKKSKLNIE